MDKKRQINFNLNNFLLAISTALDAKEKNNNINISKNHSKRISFLSLKIANNFDLKASELSDLSAYSLSYKLINDNKNVDSLISLFESFEINFKKNTFLKKIVEFSYVINTNFDLSKDNIENRKNIISFVNENSNKSLSKEICDLFLEISLSTTFWLDIQNENENLLYIYSSLNDFTKIINFEDLLEMTSIFTKMSDGENSIIKRSKIVCDYYKFEYKDKFTFLIATSLQNIGKLMIQDNVYFKKSKLDENEYEIVKSYPYYTNKILSSIMGFNDISNWASKVQETLDSKGYPNQIDAKDLSFKDRLLASLNIYNSLRSTKVYREQYSHLEAIEMMKKLAINNKIDKSIVEDFNTIFNK